MRTSHKCFPTGGSQPPYGSHRRPRPLATACAALVCAVLALPVGSPYAAPAAETSERATATSTANNPTLTPHQRLIDAGQAEEAITILRRFLGTNPKPDLLD